MELDKKTVVGAVAAVAIGAIGAAVAYNTLRGDGVDNARKPSKPSSAKTRLAEQAQSVSDGTVNINQASRGDLLRLKHIGKARAKRILASRPFKSVEELVSRGLLSEVVLARHWDRLTVRCCQAFDLNISIMAMAPPLGGSQSATVRGMGVSI